jgi:hypothetical protein
MAPVNRQQNIDDGSIRCGRSANDHAQIDCYRRATPQARIYSGGVIGLAQGCFRLRSGGKKH